MLVALLAGSLSLAGTVATVGVLSASDLFSEQPMAQQAPPEQAQPAQPTLALTPAEPRNPAAENPVPGQPAVSPPAAMTFDREEAQGVLGREVRSAADENMGRIIDVIVDRAGTVRAAVIDFGGFLGVGSRKIAVDWTALHFTAVDGKDRITVGFTKDQVKAAPEYHCVERVGWPRSVPRHHVGKSGEVSCRRIRPRARSKDPATTGGRFLRMRVEPLRSYRAPWGPWNRRPRRRSEAFAGWTGLCFASRMFRPASVLLSRFI
jgi:hypothetical protein